MTWLLISKWRVAVRKITSVFEMWRALQNPGEVKWHQKAWGTGFWNCIILFSSGKCSIQGNVLQRDMLSTGKCSILYREMFYSRICSLQGNVLFKDMLSTGKCSKQGYALYREMFYTRICSLQGNVLNKDMLSTGKKCSIQG